MGNRDMKNKYPGKCYRCGEIVNADEGLVSFEDFPSRRWPAMRFQRNWTLLEHNECAEKHAGSNIHYSHNPAPEDDFEVIDFD